MSAVQSQSGHSVLEKALPASNNAASDTAAGDVSGRARHAGAAWLICQAGVGHAVKPAGRPADQPESVCSRE